MSEILRAVKKADKWVDKQLKPKPTTVEEVNANRALAVSYVVCVIVLVLFA